MKTICKYVFCLTVVLWCVSCAKNYDINNLDKTITVGGKYFMSPLISTAQMSLETLLDSADRRKLSVKDGHYCYEIHDTIKVNFSVKKIEEKMKVKAKELTFGNISKDADRDYSVGESFNIELTQAIPQIFEFDFSDARTEGLERIDSAGFKDSRLVVSGTWKAGESPRNGDIVNITFGLPYGYVTERGDSTVKMSMKCDDDGVFTGSNSIKIFAFQSTKDMKFMHQLKMTYASAELAADLASKTKCTLALDARIGAGEGGAEQMVPEVVYGLVNVEVDAHEKSLPIEDVPQIMREAVLDLENPTILMDFASNAGIPFDADIKYSYSSTYMGRSGSCEKNLFVNATDTKGVVDSTRYYLADEENEVFEEAGYDFQEFPLRDCFYVIPDEIVLLAKPTMSQTVPQHVVWFDDYKYDVKGDVTVSLPFLFGKDLLMTVVQTFSGVPELVGSTAQKNDISILGLFENNYPQNFVVWAELRDSLDMPIGDGLFSSADTARCSMDGEVVKDTIFLNFDHCVDAIKASKIKLNINLTGSEAGRCIDSTDFLQLNLKLSTQNYGENGAGLVIDLGDLD